MRLLFFREKKKIITVNGTDNNLEILSLFKEKFKGNDQNTQHENNLIISRVDEVNKFFIERNTRLKRDFPAVSWKISP